MRFYRDEGHDILSANDIMNAIIDRCTNQRIKSCVINIIVDIESSIQYMSNTVKTRIRGDVKKQILRSAKNNNTYRPSTSNEESTLIESLKDKEVIFSKADKGNKVVVMDKKDYDDRVNHLIQEGPYEEMVYNNGKPKNPLNDMIKGAVECKKLVCELTQNKFLQYRLHVSNPKIASFYALPKIHKVSVKMRPICSNINVPTSKLADWLLTTLKK